MFDLLLAVPALVVLSPFLCLIALLVRLTSSGPVFYVQERIGKDAVPFRLIKFRTMVVGAETRGTGMLCLKDDPRVTMVGRVLRRYSLDELPQLFNVLRGSMSLVGPRPGLAYHLKEYTAFQRRRLAVLPGISGWAQVNGRSSLSWDQRIEYDVKYVDHLSMIVDLRILFRTLSVVLKDDGLFAEKDWFKEKAQSRGTR